MAESKLYAKGQITLDGALLLESQEVSVNSSSNSNEIMTMGLGYAGESPGAAMSKVTVSNAVPSADFEFHAVENIKVLKQVELVVYVGGQAHLRGRMFIIDDTVQVSATNPSAYNFEMRGPLVEVKRL